MGTCAGLLLQPAQLWHNLTVAVAAETHLMMSRNCLLCCAGLGEGRCCNKPNFINRHITLLFYTY
jgi:hypothetical protein